MSEPAGGTFNHVAQPFRLKNIEVRNRLVFQPHFTALGADDGSVSNADVAYHEERALGGVGLIILGGEAVHPTGMMSPRFHRAWDREILPGQVRLTERVHAQGARIFSQLTHGGHTSLEHPPMVLWAPTQMPEPYSNATTKALDKADIKQVIEGFVCSALNALEAGFDGIEVKVAHDGLLRSFVSPAFNHRNDEYGGSFDKRLRLPVEVMQAIKGAIGDDVPLGVRLCMNEYTSFGYGSEYGLRVAQYLDRAGVVDYFNCDAGSFSSFWMEIPPYAIPEGSFVELSRELKKASKLPVIAFGRIKRPEMAEEILARGEADLIGMCRQLICDPETPRKLLEGRIEEIRFCVGCNDACIYQVMQEKGVRCIHNPVAGRESIRSERGFSRAQTERRVVVVGGGPAGMKVAEVSALRGHEVTLLERETELGGQVRLAAKQPLHGEILEVSDYLERRMALLGVDVWLGTEADAEGLADLEADVYVIATGSEPNLPPVPGEARKDRDGGKWARERGLGILPSIPGVDLPHVFSSDEVLRGAELPGKRVLVVDGSGHWEAAGTAEFLADFGYEVEVITARGQVGSDLEPSNFVLYAQRAAEKGIRLRAGTELVAIELGRTCLRDAVTGVESWVKGFDAVIPVLTRRSRDDLYWALVDRLFDKDVRIERVGDAAAPRLVQAAILEAFELGREL
jgi:2,4-dienoyl-CoA reductase-like NADH-dependent reductase (Old Yellow Enzyme family)